VASTNVVGLDIGSNQIKAVHLERRRNGWGLQNAAIGLTPPDAVQDGLILDIPGVTEAIRQLFRENRFPNNVDTVAAVSGPHVQFRPIQMPDMNEATLRKTIRFEASKYIDQAQTGVSLENSAVEFEILGRAGDPPHLDVLLVVAPQPMVNGRVQVMEQAGLEPVAVDLEAFALLRAIEAAHLSPSAGQALVVMNMGATYTELNIVVEKDVHVRRSMPIGGNAITTSLASALSVPLEEAEFQKRQTDIFPTHGNGLGPGSLSTPDPIRQVTLPIVDELIRELRRSVIFFQSQAAEAGVNVAVEQVLLSGGGAQLPGLADYLRERLGMTVTSLDPFVDATGAMTGHLQDQGPELAVATGLALKDYT